MAATSEPPRGGGGMMEFRLPVHVRQHPDGQWYVREVDGSLVCKCLYGEESRAVAEAIAQAINGWFAPEALASRGQPTEVEPSPSRTQDA